MSKEFQLCVKHGENVPNIVSFVNPEDCEWCHPKSHEEKLLAKIMAKYE